MVNYCFKFGPDKKTWAEAEVACIAIGGNLASIHNQNYLKFAKGVIKSAAGSGTPVWIGGSDAENEGVWLWRDGTMFDFMFWAPGNPDNAGGRENCMELSSQGGANDANCNDKKPYLCGMYV
uniref:galactose-specific lectin nattectin-like n=1 Tax=Monopterus albus TaxID=43700 RepID=UPI0009B4B3D9|nr:galactose-specific lectin nattectin-like [Monopterus albus]